MGWQAYMELAHGGGVAVRCSTLQTGAKVLSRKSLQLANVFNELGQKLLTRLLHRSVVFHNSGNFRPSSVAIGVRRVRWGRRCEEILEQATFKHVELGHLQ